jgi:cell wall-associated NlpC family hydrolase
MDCLGLLFLSIRNAYGIPWQQWETSPSKLIRQLAPGGKDPQIFWVGDSAGLASLETGDFLFFLGYAQAEDSAIALDQSGRPLYGWHTGIYAGSGTMLHCAPCGNTRGVPGQRVMYEDLRPFMEASGCYDFVVRVQPYEALDALSAQYKNKRVK